jgi:hypothetical protein
LGSKKSKAKIGKKLGFSPVLPSFAITIPSLYVVPSAMTTSTSASPPTTPQQATHSTINKSPSHQE